jgi:hypothetical protein
MVRIAMVIAGAMVGAISLSMLSLLFHWLFFRSVLSDGQYAFVFFLTVPVGAILGALTSLVWVCLSLAQRETAGRIALFGGSVLTILLLFLGVFALSGTEKPTVMDRLTATVFWCGLPLLWSSALTRIGISLLLKR